MTKITDYLKETKAELAHVNWPTRAQTIGFTVLVVVISALVAYLLGLFDFAFARIISSIIG